MFLKYVMGVLIFVWALRAPSLVCGGLGVAAEAASARLARGGTLPGAGVGTQRLRHCGLEPPLASPLFSLLLSMNRREAATVSVSPVISKGQPPNEGSAGLCGAPRGFRGNLEGPSTVRLLAVRRGASAKGLSTVQCK
jgi:hypothetical protein